jgi:hypothetical protein
MDAYQDGYDWIKHCFVCDGYFIYNAISWDSLYSHACRSCQQLAESARRNLEASDRAARIQYIQDGYERLIPPQTH